jgi:hypothetical protein
VAGSEVKSILHCKNTRKYIDNIKRRSVRTVDCRGHSRLLFSLSGFHYVHTIHMLMNLSTVIVAIPATYFSYSYAQTCSHTLQLPFLLIVSTSVTLHAARIQFS